jgi:hypothetical protein
VYINSVNVFQPINIKFFVYLVCLNSHMYTGKGCEGTNKCKIRKKLQLNRGGEFTFYNRIPYSEGDVCSLTNKTLYCH